MPDLLMQQSCVKTCCLLAGPFITKILLHHSNADVDQPEQSIKGFLLKFPEISACCG